MWILLLCVYVIYKFYDFGQLDDDQNQMQNTYKCMMYAFVPVKMYVYTYTEGDMLFQ